MKDKQGNKVNGKEFMQRWKQGIQEITPLQSTSISLWSSIWVLIGIILGIIICWMQELYWVVLILWGSLFLSVMSFIGIWQKYNVLKTMETMIKQRQGDDDGKTYVG